MATDKERHQQEQNGLICVAIAMFLFIGAIFVVVLAFADGQWYKGFAAIAPVTAGVVFLKAAGS